jgi:hypothetical protein
MMTDLPSLTILGVTLRCYLDASGRRVYDAADVLALMEAWGDGATVSEEDRRAFAEWKRERE